jgi:cytochrome c-type biogenesis protein CcmF
LSVELGHAALWLAAAFALLQGLAPWLRAPADDADRWTGLAVPAALAQALLVTLAFGTLMHAFAVSDFSVKLVFANSHTMKPMIYKLSGVWGNHEGSMLLWILVMALAGACVALADSPLGRRFRSKVLSVQGIIALGFYAFLLGASNPFERLSPAPTEGNGLNPLLQDPGLAFHPPMLYAGYVGLSVAFAFAVAALMERRVGPAWAAAARPWVLAAWAALTCGITLGSWWAYYELGWGGYWFWDPVENASLMPWLAATALLHSIAVLAKRDALRNWTVLLAVVGFSLSMIGTFVVRSGLLTSVHAFAVDPARGAFLLVLLAIYIGGALLLYALRASTVAVGEGFSVVSREGVLVANNLLLCAGLGVVFVGSTYPLVIDIIGADKISVGPPYFNSTFGPLMVPLVALMAVGPYLDWGASRANRLPRKLSIPAFAAIALALFAFAMWNVRGAFSLIGFALAGWLALATIGILWGRTPWRTPRATWGMACAHLGVAVTLFGLTTSGALTRELLVNLRIGEAASVAGYDMKLLDVRPVAGANWTALEATLAVNRDGQPLTTLYPQARLYTTPMMDTTEAAIHTRAGGDLYAVLGKPDGSGRWQLHVWWKPFVWWIWAGGLMMAAGGVLSMSSRARARSTAARPEAALIPVAAE